MLASCLIIVLYNHFEVSVTDIQSDHYSDSTRYDKQFQDSDSDGGNPLITTSLFTVHTEPGKLNL
jgi:hypothetical protein